MSGRGLKVEMASILCYIQERLNRKTKMCYCYTSWKMHFKIVFSSEEQYIKLKIPNVQIAIKRFVKVICSDKDESLDI